MSDQEINIAIAEACLTPGTFRTFGFGCDGRDMGELRGWWKNQESNRRSDFVTEIPDYCNDLNAMHEAEELFELSAKFGAHDYAANLYHICVPRDMQYDDHFICWVVAFYLLNATARQRAEAFLRTLGKWKEEAK